MGRLMTLARYVAFLAVVSAVVDFTGQDLFASPPPPICSEMCGSSSCEELCYIDMMEFENGNDTTCLEYGAYDTEQYCCGDFICEPALGESDCAADCGQNGDCDGDPQCDFVAQTGCGQDEVCNNKRCCIPMPWVPPGPPPPACYDDYCDGDEDCCDENFCFFAWSNGGNGFCVPDIVHR